MFKYSIRGDIQHAECYKLIFGKSQAIIWLLLWIYKLNILLEIYQQILYLKKIKNIQNICLCRK